MTDKQRKICEDLGWEVYETEDDIELRKCSSLGEDFGFSVKQTNSLKICVITTRISIRKNTQQCGTMREITLEEFRRVFVLFWMTRLKSTECLKICALSYPDPKSKEESES